MRPPYFARTAAVIVSCAPACAHSQSVPSHDDSIASHVGGVSAVEIEPRDVRHLHGVVEQIDRPTSAVGEGAWTRMRVAGAGAPEARSFIVLVEPGGALPLAVGDDIDATIDCRFGGWHHVCGATVRDASGSLLWGYSGAGDASFAPGWRLAQLPARGGRGRTERGIALTHAGRTAVTTPGQWRQLVTPDGTWLVYGSQVAWAGGGVRPPDSADYVTLAVTRVR